MVEIAETPVSKRARELFDKGSMAMERNNLDYAMEMFAAALELEPRFLKARKYLRAAGLKRFTDSGKGATTHQITLITGLPALVQGFLALKTGQAMKALSIGEQLLRQDPLNLYFIRLLCQAAVAAGLPEVAIETLSAVRSYYPGNVELITWLGDLYTSANQLNDARTCFETVVNLRPHDAKALMKLKDAMARDTMAKGGWTEASQEGGSYRDLIKDAKEADVLERDSKAVKDRKSVDVLIQDMQERMKQEPENVNFRRNLANLYVQANRFDDAIRTLEDARRIVGAADPHLDRALANIYLKKFDVEIAQCRENGDTAGMAAKQAAKDKFLFEDLRNRVERYPNDLPLRYEYGVQLYRYGEQNAAIEQFQLAQRNPQFRVQAMYYMGLCFKAKQQLDMAREAMEKAAAELPEMNDLKKDIFYELGDILEQTGQAEQAVNQYYKEIYQTDIRYKDVAAKIDKFYHKPS